MTSNHTTNHFNESAPFEQSNDIIKEENNGEYELCDIAAIKTENQQNVEQEISTEQIYRYPSSEYTLQLVNNNNDCTLICDEHGDCQISTKFQKNLQADDDFFSPYILKTPPFEIPSVIKQTDDNRQKLEYNSAFKPVYHHHYNISGKEAVRIDTNRQHMEYNSAFKPVYHSAQNERDEVKKIGTIRQKIKYNSAFKPVFNSNSYVADNTKGINNSRQNPAYSSAFKPVCHSIQNNSEEMTGIDYKRIRLNENIPLSYQDENTENFLNYTTVQPVNRSISQSNTGTWVDVNYNFGQRQEADLCSPNELCHNQNITSYTEKLVSNNDIAALLMRQIEAIETTNKLLKEIILTNYSAPNKENESI